MPTGFIWDERFAWFGTANVQRGPFFTPLGAFNTRESKERIRELLVATGVADQLAPIAPRVMTEEELFRNHSREYVIKVKTLSEGVGATPARTPISPRGYNLNVPLPPGSGHAYVETMKQVVMPALARFRPEAIVVASVPRGRIRGVLRALVRPRHPRVFAGVETTHVDPLSLPSV
jgi:acetoin utilization deacetylase AcuC-like enzyme